MAENKNASEIEALKVTIKNMEAIGKNPVEYEGTLMKLRDLLYASINKDDFKWYTVNLKMGQRGLTTTPYKIQVCAPVMVYGYFVPVTADETWKMANTHGAFPLTRAVADQEANEAVDRGTFVSCRPQNIATHKYGFNTFTKKLIDSKYSQAGSGPVQGSHKLWLLSSKLTADKPVNYGFHHKGKRLPEAQGFKGKYLYPEYDVVNGLIKSHAWNYYDYSQLLQLMKGFTDGDGKAINLRDALNAKHDAVWDEDLPPSAVKFPTTTT